MTNDLRLFALYVGGAHPRATIEVHDVQFAVAARVEDAIPLLRERWWGRPSSLHLDAYADIRVVDGYAIEPVPRTKATPGPALYFVNTGGYHAGVFGELHAYSLHVAHDKREVWKTAKARAADFSQVHKDNLDIVDDVIRIDDTLTQTPYALSFTKTDAANDIAITAKYLKLNEAS